MVPFHPEAVPGHPDQVRWILPPGATPAGALSELVADGTLAEVHVQGHAVLTRLGAGRTWSADGPRVRAALHAALAATAPTAAHDPDSALRAATRELLDGPVGAFASSHGGRIDLVGVHDGVVEVRLGGACHGCPAAAATLRGQLERQLRQRCEGLREVRAVGPLPPRRSGSRARLARLGSG